MRRVKPKLAAGSQKLREACERRGMIMADLVRCMREFDIPQATTLNYYHGNTTPPMNKMILLAQVLGVKPTEVFNWYYPANPNENVRLGEILNGKA